VNSIGNVASRPEYYPAIIRILHWMMAIGFAIVWLTGVLTVNLEGLGSQVTDDLQGSIRDFHKSLAITLIGLTVVRLLCRWTLPIPTLPPAIPRNERLAAYVGHGAIYVLTVATALTGLSIADLQAFGNAYFGIVLPPVFPETASVWGWSVDPWSYVLHGGLAYGLLLLVLTHAAAVSLHRRQGVDLSHRIIGRSTTAVLWTKRASWILLLIAAITFVAALRGHLTVGPAETPRNYSAATRPS
jgi:cytochrome b561